MEFVELYGEPGESLDGMVLVFFNGSADNSYYAADLDGYSLDAGGFFVIGNAAVPNVSVVFANSLLQQGPDAVVLYYGDAADWPMGTPITDSNIIDALVYDTNDVDDPGLLLVLNPGQSTVDEAGGGDVANHSNSRIPNGGVQRNTDSYTQQLPTPGFSNSAECLGGEVSDSNGNTSLVFCASDPLAEIAVTNNSQAPGDVYYFVLTDEANNIISYSAGTILNVSEEGPGFCRIWGLAVIGLLDVTTAESGDPLSGIISSDCLSISSNFISIEKINCVCDGGSVMVNEGIETIAVCLDNVSDLMSLASQNQAQGQNYVYVLTDANNLIISLIYENTYDFNFGSEGICRVWGLSYSGSLDPATTQAGLSAGGILSDGACVDLSDNFVAIDKQECLIVDGCTDLFFSEYLEGTGFNKALEIYNPTSGVIDLAGYTVSLYTNGNVNPQTTYALSGSIAPSEVFVIANSQAVEAILNQADATSSVTIFNGNDAVELRKNGVVIDVIGQVGEDPAGGYWPVGNGSTSDYTLVRKMGATYGNTDWNSASAEWNVYPLNTAEFLGVHSVYPCVQSPSVTFNGQADVINEDDGTYVLSVSGLNLTDDVVCTLSYAGGTAADLADYQFEFGLPIDFTISANAPEAAFSVFIVDDEDIENAETIEFSLSCASPDIIITEGLFEITILDNDVAIYPIEGVTGVDENGELEAAGLICELRGVVYGYNLRTDGLQFTLIDPTDGIGVYSSIEDFGYVVNEGDSLHIVGEIGQFNGLSQILPQAVTLISSGNALVEPIEVSELNEGSESHLVELKCIHLTDPTQWTNEGSGFDVEVSNDNNTFILRVDAESDVFGSPAPQGVFNAIGIGSQNDATLPYTSGYQLIPRYLDDISSGFTVGYSLTGDISIAGEDTCLVSGATPGSTTWQASPVGAADYQWMFEWANGSFEAQGQEVTFEASQLSGSTEEITVTLSVQDLETLCSVIFSNTYCVIQTTEIQETSPLIRLYPMPFNVELHIAAEQEIMEVIVFGVDGRLIVSEVPHSFRFALNTESWAPGRYHASIFLRSGETLRVPLLKQ
jgi:hypothetical protein